MLRHGPGCRRRNLLARGTMRPQLVRQWLAEARPFAKKGEQTLELLSDSKTVLAIFM